MVLPHLCKKMLSVFLEKGVHRRVHPTQMVKQVIIIGSTQNVIITEKTIKKARNLFLRNKSNENRQNFIHKKRTYNKTKRKFKFQFKRREGERIAKSNSKSFWKNIKSQYRTKANDPEISINDLFTHFNGLYGLQTENTTNRENDPQFRSLYDHDLDSPFTETEIRTAVFEQKNSKSSGTDNLISEVFKNSFDIISPFLLSLYNKLLDSGIFPESWGEGIIVPIFKGGNLEAKNFRGITLNNIISKIYSKLLVNRLTKWSDKHQKFIDNQFGFQIVKSTVDCIFIIHALISKTLASKKKLYVAFLDWEKMFDRIDRAFLWQKLLSESVSTKFIQAIRAMYSSVKSFIRYKHATSDFINTYIGVKQGDPLSSILCLFFLNDILRSINCNLDGIMNLEELQIFLLLFADDGVLFSQSPQTLQSMLNDVHLYCETWGLRLNVTKTKIMIFEKGRHTAYNFHINNQLIEIVSSFKYLGVYLYKNGNWYRTQKRVSQHASYSLHNLFIVFNQIELPVSKKSELFDSLVLPVLNYAAEIWGAHDAPDIEVIHTKFCRKLLTVKRSTNLNALYGELGRVPMLIHRKIIMIKYWLKIIALHDNSLLFRTYQMLKRNLENGSHCDKTNWAYQIRNILQDMY